jgi:indole-3-glycerol phosphate synthase
LDSSRKSLDILDRIVDRKRLALKRAKERIPLSMLARQVKEIRTRDFQGALTGDAPSVIAEVKKASPSAGLLRPEYDPVETARAYEKAGAAAISVLTEENYFQGSLKYLSQVKEAVSLPVLRKDFIFDKYQIYETIAGGADAVLLIARILTQQELEEMVELCYKLRLHPLVEIYEEDEVAKVVSSGARIVGINNRDLRTLKVDIERTVTIKKLLPDGLIVVSESGIRSNEEIRRLTTIGVRAYLIGESLLRQKDPGKALPRLLHG